MILEALASASWRIPNIDAYFRGLGPEQLAVNVGLTAVVAAGAFVVSSILSQGLRWILSRIGEKRAGSRRGGGALAVSWALGLVNLAIWAALLMLLLDLWGFDTLRWASGPGAPLVAAALRVVLVVVIAVVGFEAAMTAIDKVLGRAAETADNARRAAQLRSLAPLVRGAARTLIAVAAGLVIISQIGVEIGPLLAGAGVLGVAVGFGAQTIVKDYLTGFSLILEDIVSIGDVARIGADGGLVESMTLRTINLRDFDGTLHVIPYSEAQVIHNLTKTFSYYVFDLQVSYNSDIDRAMEIIRRTGEALQADPELGKDILEPIEVSGVDQLADSGVLLKARIKTAPIRQWAVGREFNRRIKLAFDEAGIEIPFPHMQLVFSDRAIEAVRAGAQHHVDAQ